ncbi:MAG: replicative DNA helicase [Scytonema sp. PMC 1069.18]|nr:replicative DNA helicase [Scytonema sp. PMC 1069.18]MEC4883896.1 replicative DNA helicase [Scytonema sp. PMC 1070.18]
MSEELNFQGNGIDRLPPQNIEAEEAILGGILLDPEAISRISDRLIPEAFYISAHKDIFHATLRLHGQGKPTDLLTVINWLNDHDLLARVGGRNKLATLVDRTVSAVNIDALAELVMEKYLRRQLIKAGNEIVHLGYQAQTELPVILDQAEQKVFGVTQERPQVGLVHIGDTLINAFQDIESRHQGIALPGIPCGFYDLDAMTTGFQRSDLIIVAGRPSMGKCVAYDTEIVLADGSIATIQDIYHRRQAELLTLTNDWKFEVTQPSVFVDDGIKPVFRVTTRLGRSVETTITHPYLTIYGWRPLSELKVDEKVAVPRKINVFGTKKVREDEVKQLADFIGEGCLKDIPDFVFQLERSQISLFLNHLFATNGWTTLLDSGQAQIGYDTISKKLVRQIQHLLLRFGIIATLKKQVVKYKDTPRIAWQLDINDAESIKTFIAEIGIFEQENSLFNTQQALIDNRYQTKFDHIKVEKGEPIKAAKSREAWRVLALQSGKQEHTNIHTNKHALTQEYPQYYSNKRKVENRFLEETDFLESQRALTEQYWEYPNALENLTSQKLTTEDVYWDEIVSIELVGYKHVYDLTIPETHNFIANDICVHNTAFCLNLAHNIAASYKLPVAVFSLEMSKDQLVQRLLASEAGIETGYLRSGRISQTQWEPLSRAIGLLSEMPIYIDDTPNITVTEMRSQARRLQAEIGSELGLIIIDYLQLMEGAGDNRVQELSRITRSIKGLARELCVPIIALSQLSRGVESRTNKRPMLSDLRESGCLTGDSLVTLANNGLQVPIQELVGKSGFSVWALNEATMQLEKAVVSNAFSTGVKPVLRLRTRLGRTIRATGNHKFLTIHGWRRLDELQMGDRIALPRCLPNSIRTMQSLLGVTHCGTTLYKQNLSRERAARLATVVKSEEINRLANSDIYWDEILSIEFDGEEEVYDLTVSKLHNFIANNIIVHNSIEQDADLVLMLYRDDYYNSDSPDRGITEVIIAKHRNGPTGIVKLLFDPQFTKFKNLARPGGY